MALSKGTTVGSPHLDLDYRPRSYWAPSLPGPTPETSDGRNRPSVAPGFGDRAYLPEGEDDEVEVALVSLESTLGDVISVRARRISDGIRYHVVDEYGTRFVVREAVRPRELTLGELIELLDTVEDFDNNLTGLTDCYRDMHVDADGDPEELIDFVRVRSQFYPQLEDYYAERADAWAEEARRRRGG